MKIQFDILNQEIDLTNILNSDTKEWWFRNSLPQIPIETKVEDLTNDQKISLVKLAIYEGWLNDEELCNLPKKYFKINPST